MVIPKQKITPQNPRTNKTLIHRDALHSCPVYRQLRKIHQHVVHASPARGQISVPGPVGPLGAGEECRGQCWSSPVAVSTAGVCSQPANPKHFWAEIAFGWDWGCSAGRCCGSQHRWCCSGMRCEPLRSPTSSARSNPRHPSVPTTTAHPTQQHPPWPRQGQASTQGCSKRFGLCCRGCLGEPSAILWFSPMQITYGNSFRFGFKF